MSIYQLFITLSQLIALQGARTTRLAPGHLWLARPAPGALYKVTAGDLSHPEWHRASHTERWSGSVQHCACRRRQEQKWVVFK